ncbi:MAG: hypothetical protein KME14_07770 [Tildeniella torsiva UHER 1998/13D]|jgi:hypothetical protein|nr:hypothetical protein [Tildeniella torsiva UHER 1998/13D]
MSLALVGCGSVEYKFPQALEGFDDGYTGRGFAGLVLLIVELILMVTWGRIAGLILIALGILLLLVYFFCVTIILKEDSKHQEMQ